VSGTSSAATADDSLAGDKRQATVDRILQAARHLIGERGIDLTMDEIAEVAGVGRRTVFRHFNSREALLAAAIESGIRRYGEQLPVYAGGDWHEWLGQMCHAMHRLNGNYGRGSWELT
jgi:AcrR family transcriptional regulator